MGEVDRVGGRRQIDNAVNIAGAKRGLEHEGVGPGAAGELIGPETPVENVPAWAAGEVIGASVSDERIGATVAGAVDETGADEDQGFDASREHVGYRAFHDI